MQQDTPQGPASINGIIQQQYYQARNAPEQDPKQQLLGRFSITPTLDSRQVFASQKDLKKS